ncbi:MAG: EAL domain-containing protein [Gammaproteobacteria bacterium]|nr:EAL domain-containing protein [Gammaproteobacteria bacterium]
MTTASELLHRLGLHSLRSRYITTAVLVSLLLTLAASIGWQYVESVTGNQLINVQHRAAASDTMSDATAQTHILETQFYRYITLPSATGREMIQQTFQHHAAAINILHNNPWLQKDPALLELINALQHDHQELSREIETLLEVRGDENKWFPAMATIQGEMYILNTKFMSALELLTHELGDDLETPEKLELYKSLTDIRHNWQLMIGEFRLFVANSFGIFSNNPQAGMRTRKTNINMYYAYLDTQLNQLIKHNRVEQLNLVSSDSVYDLRSWLTQWHNDYSHVVMSYNNDRWRVDLMLLRERVEPILARIRQRSSTLQQQLSVASAKDITRLTTLAHNFSNFVIYLASIIIAAGLLGFVVFHRTILRPIADIAQALNDEASGKQRVPVPRSSAEEIGDLTQAFATMREQIRTREAHLDHMVHHDALTQLPNRLLFHRRLENAINQAVRDNTLVGVMFLDLDRFKQINDTLGHDIGDLLLQVVAKRLSGCLRSTDSVARLGGDEFAIILNNVSNTDQLITTANKILRELKTPFSVAGTELYTSASIGIALGPKQASDVETLTKNADIAMYHAKSLGRNTFHIFTAEMTSQVLHKATLETQLRHAMNHNQFILYYQPIIDLRSGRIISTEALLRWQHPERGLLAPAEFLPVLHDSGLIKPVSQWVLLEVGKQFLAYKTAGQINIRIAVNMSGFAFRNDTILDFIDNAIEHTQMDPKGLIIEITEDTLLEELTSAQSSLKTLQEMGIRIALDDFGTGQSSLNHLRHSPIDIIKIDRDFINHIPIDRSDSDLVDAIIAMAHKLHIKVVAEGVENKQQVDFLHWHKCDAIQGYYFSPPCPSQDILAMLTQDRKILGQS